MLDHLGIKHLGTYRSEAEYRRNRVFVLEVNGLKLAFLNYTYALNGQPVPLGARVGQVEDEAIIADVEEARARRPDAVIAIFHAGQEYLREPDAYQRHYVDLLLNEGVDVVLGGHPHVLQPFEMVSVTDRHGETKPRLIAWSLGNFISNQRDRYCDGGIIFRFTLAMREGRLEIGGVDYVPRLCAPPADRRGHGARSVAGRGVSRERSGIEAVARRSRQDDALLSGHGRDACALPGAGAGFGRSAP